MKRDLWPAFSLSLAIHLLILLLFLGPVGNAVVTFMSQTDSDVANQQEVLQQGQEEAHHRHAPQDSGGQRLSISIAMIVSADSPEASDAEGYSLGMVTHKVVPDYPFISSLYREEGTAYVLVAIDKGVVTSVGLDRSSGSSRLDNAALHALTQWRFRENVTGLVRIPVRFRLGS